MSKVVWITWERQRRSVTLAGLMADEYCEFSRGGHPLLRYLRCLRQTSAALWRNRHGTVIVQDPSVILAAWAALWRLWLPFSLVIDRHTDPYILGGGEGWHFPLLLRMDRWALRVADRVIVTNAELVPYVERAGGRALILPDPYPQLDEYLGEDPPALNDAFSLFCVASWSEDEPLAAYIAAARALPDVRFYISGKPREPFLSLLRDLPPNLITTGFLSERDYYRLMAACHGVIAYSSRAATLVCGGYEAVALGKPFITGDSSALRSYFEPALSADGSVPGLQAAIVALRDGREALSAAVTAFRQASEVRWRQQFECVVDEIRSLDANPQPVKESS